MKRLLAAIAFLTRVPVRRTFSAEDVGRASLWFPLVGAAIGAFLYGLSLPIAKRLPTRVVATVLVAASAWVTRAFHLDGLGDFADGLGGGRDRDERLRIMRDSRIGAFGAVVIVLVILLKVTALDALLSRGAALPSLVLVSSLARWTALPMSYWLPYARVEGGLGSALTAHAGRVEMLVASFSCGALMVWLSPRLGAAVWMAAIATSVTTAAIALRRLGGITGDVLGANVELSEAVGYLVAVAVAAP